MKKSKAKYVMQCDSHPIHQTTNLCIFMENEELVDLTVICDTFSVRVHKCVLGANSAYFLDHLQRDMNIDRVVIQGIKQNVVKALIEFMYCGETSVLDEDMDELVAAAKFFGIRAISALVPDSLGGHPKSNQGPKSKLECRPPQFLKKNQNHNRRRRNKNPITMYHELVSHTATTNDETRKYITLKNQLLFDDVLTHPPRETCEQTVYDAPDNIDLKFESLELVEINSSIKNELHEFLNIVNEEGATYQQVTNASGLEPIIYTADVPDYMTVNFQDSNVTQYSAEQKEHVYLLEAAKALTATPVTYNELEVDTVTEYKLDAATGEYVVQHEQDTVAESSTQCQQDTVAGAESSTQLDQDITTIPGSSTQLEQKTVAKSSTQLEHDTVAELSTQLEQGSVARARSSPKLEHDIVAGSSTQLEQTELAGQFEQDAVVGAGSSPQLKQDTVTESSTQLEQDTLAKPTTRLQHYSTAGAGSLTQRKQQDTPSTQLEQDFVDNYGELVIDDKHNDAEPLNLVVNKNSKRAKKLKNKLKYD